MALRYISVCIFNMTLHGHLEIRNFSSHVEEYFQMGLFAFQHFKKIKFANFAEFCPMALLRVNGLIGLTCAYIPQLLSNLAFLPNLHPQGVSTCCTTLTENWKLPQLF